MTETVAGIEYQHPTVTLLQETGIGTSEIAARTCYDSFILSENDCIKDFETLNKMGGTNLELINGINHSDLLDTLAWTHFHHSILEHANLTYLIQGTSRGVLQEHARHRIQAISVRSTRYTMSSVINAFVASKFCTEAAQTEFDVEESLIAFLGLGASLDLFVTTNAEYNENELASIYLKLNHQFNKLGYKEFYNTSAPKSSWSIFEDSGANEYTPQQMFKMLEAGKKKRNVGDAFKHIVTDNWKVDMVVTMNLRALKNYLDLRDSGAAYFQARWLAQAIKSATPQKYLDLIVKK